MDGWNLSYKSRKINKDLRIEQFTSTYDFLISFFLFSPLKDHYKTKLTNKQINLELHYYLKIPANVNGTTTSPWRANIQRMGLLNTTYIKTTVHTSHL